MIAETNYTGIAAVITAAGVFIAACAAAYVTVRTSRTVKETHAMVKQVDAAVNGKPPGATTMVAQIQQLHDDKFPPPEETDALLPLLRKVAADVASLKPPA